jgi:hypothetical protein
MRKRDIKNFKIYFPLLVLFSVVSGFAKLGGITFYAFVVICTTIPVLMLCLFKGYIEPSKILKNLIQNIEFTENDIYYSNGEVVFTPNKVHKKFGLRIFETNIKKYYILEFEAKKYYLIPDFFENFNLTENRINGIK